LIALETKYIENYYNKGGPDSGDYYIGSDSFESARIFFVSFMAFKNIKIFED
jgi:hypothetical protein